MSDWAARRFWTRTEVAEEPEGYGVRLDGRPLRTPAKAPLLLPTRALAEAVAREWAAQDDRIAPLTMPFTRTANSAIDKVAPQHPEVVALVAEYGATDLLCYRAEGPEELVARQAAAWDPLLDWAAGALGARLAVTRGVMPADQDPAALAALRRGVAAMCAFELAGFHDLVALSGSLVLGFATRRDRAAPEALWSISRIDEDWQAEHWGIDAEAAQAAGRKRAAFLDAAAFCRMSASTA